MEALCLLTNTTEDARGQGPGKSGSCSHVATTDARQHHSLMSKLHSESQGVLRAVVEDEHQRATHAAHDVRQETLVQALRQALLRGDLLEAISSALVQVLLHGLLRLHLQAAAHGVEGVCGASTAH